MHGLLLLVGFVLATLLPLFAASPADAFRDGKLLLDLRTRLESVDQDNIEKDSLAFTLRTRLGWQTADWKGWSLLSEFENITALDGDGYNNTKNGEPRPVIADPGDTEVNRLQLNWHHQQHSLSMGRQRLIWDNARFIGNVGWRQNEQTFDGLVWQESLPRKTKLTVAWLANANRIFGEHHPNPLNADWRMNTWLARLEAPLGPLGKLAVFAHFIDLDDLPALSHRNLGFRLAGKNQLNSQVSLQHELSYVVQDPHAQGDQSLDNEYTHLSLGPGWGVFALTANYELLGGNSTRGFITPLATLHAFNGWADLFLNTPASGLEDLFIKFSAAPKGWTFALAAHRFEGDDSGLDFGDEWDLLVSHQWNKRLGSGLKYADFQGEGVDVRKVWLWCHYRL